MTIEMTTTTDHTEIRNSADDDARSDERAAQLLTTFVLTGTSSNFWNGEPRKDATIKDLTAEIERLRAGIDVEKFVFNGLGFTGVVARLDALLAQS